MRTRTRHEGVRRLDAFGGQQLLPMGRMARSAARPATRLFLDHGLGRPQGIGRRRRGRIGGSAAQQRLQLANLFLQSGDARFLFGRASVPPTTTRASNRLHLVMVQHELLHGPYKAPADRTVCLYRDTEVVITSWTDAPISWSRCRAIGVRLLIDEELLQAIRTEWSLAIQYWWGVRVETVSFWRKAFGVLQWGTEGSRRLHEVHAERMLRPGQSNRAPDSLSRCVSCVERSSVSKRNIGDAN